MATTARAIGIAAVATLALAGCSAAQPADGPVTLTYAIWDENQRPAMEQIADEFESEHDDVTIDIQITPNSEYWTKLQTSMSGGSGPDVFWMNGPRFGLYAAEGQLAPLTDAGLEEGSYPESLIDLYTFDGQVYGAPKDFDTVALWYNEALFDAAGVEYPTADWTWDDVRENAAALTDPDAGVFGIAAAPYSQENYFDSIHQAGGYVISEDHTDSGFDAPETAAGVQYWLDMIEDGSSPTAQQMVDTIPEDSFQAGSIAMIYMASYMALPFSESAVADDLQVVRLPQGPAGNQSIIHGLANVANAASDNVELASEFAAFASGERAAQIQAETGTVIPAFEGTQQVWVDAIPELDLQVFIDAQENAVPYPISANTAEWASPMADTMAQIWAGAVSIEDGLAQINEQMQAALDEEQAGS